MRRFGVRKGQYRTKFWPEECTVLDVGKLKHFLKSNKATTLVEYRGLRFSIHVTRTSDALLHLSGCPPPVDHQDIGLVEVPWGPGKRLRRFFFLCPYCDEKSAKLYIPWGGTGFGCRRCKDVTYRPQRDLLSELVVAHEYLGREIDAVIRRRALRKTHITPPTTDAEIHAHTRRLVRDVEKLHKQIGRHAGNLGFSV